MAGVLWALVDRHVVLVGQFADALEVALHGVQVGDDDRRLQILDRLAELRTHVGEGGVDHVPHSPVGRL